MDIELAEKRTKRLPIEMSDPMWKLLGKCLVAWDHEAMLCGMRHVTPSRLISAIMAAYLIQNVQDIRDEYYRIMRETEREALPRFFGYEQLEAIEASTGSNICTLLRSSSRRRDSKRIAEQADRAIRSLRRRPAGTVLRAHGGPITLRGWGYGFSPTITGGLETVGVTVSDGDGPAKPSHCKLVGAEAPPTQWRDSWKAYVDYITE